MFPQVNQLFRKKSITDIASLKIPQEKKKVLDKYNIDCRNVTLGENGDMIAYNLEDKLNVMGAFLVDINNDRPIENPRFTKIIKDKVKEFLEEIEEKRNNNITLCTFNENNQSDRPQTEHLERYFTSTAALEKKFRRLSNKKSSGIDTIPNVVLKRIPQAMIRDYAILFNNLLNHKFFPRNWKKAKVVPILKKDKENTNPANYRPISLLPNIRCMKW